MKKPNAVSTDCDFDRRAVLKFGAGISAFAVASHDPVSAAVLANNDEIVALSARAVVDYVRRGEISAERYAQVLLDRYKVHTNLNTVTYIDEARLPALPLKSSVTTVLVAGAATERRVDPAPCFARAW